jgi:hypothetical protein
LAKKKEKRPPLFERPDIKKDLEMVVSMCFSELIASKALRRI